MRLWGLRRCMFSTCWRIFRMRSNLTSPFPLSRPVGCRWTPTCMCTPHLPLPLGGCAGSRGSYRGSHQLATRRFIRPQPPWPGRARRVISSARPERPLRQSVLSGRGYARRSAAAERQERVCSGRMMCPRRQDRAAWMPSLPPFILIFRQRIFIFHRKFQVFPNCRRLSSSCISDRSLSLFAGHWKPGPGPQVRSAKCTHWSFLDCPKIPDERQKK